MELFDKLGIDIGYVLLGTIGVTLILFILCIVLLCKQGKLKKKYKQFMSGKDGQSLEEEVVSRFNDISDLKEDTKKIFSKIEKLEDNLKVTYQKVGLIKYDAFKEMGGKLSFVVALLTEENDGFLLNSMHSSREGCYTYIKEIIKGESFVLLSEEEKQALEAAKKSRNYME
jgi:hypothetical protein